MAKPTTLKNKFAQANSNGVTIATIFTHGTGLLDPGGSASGGGGVLDRLIVKNPDTVAHGIRLYRVVAAGSAGVTNEIDFITLAADAPPYIFEGPLYSLDSAFYQVKLTEAKTTTEVSIQAYYHEMTA